MNEWEIEIDDSLPADHEREVAAKDMDAYYSARDSGDQYGVVRSLRVPDGKIERAHFASPSRRGRERVSNRIQYGRAGYRAFVRQRYGAPERPCSDARPQREDTRTYSTVCDMIIDRKPLLRPPAEWIKRWWWFSN
jgi:hypothetical protein